MRNINLDEMNMNETGPERIWVHKQFAEFWFDSNSQRKRHTIDKTIDFLEGARKEAEKNHYIHVVVRPTHIADDDHDFGSDYLVVEGWRLETDDEYQKRLKSLIVREKHEKEMYEAKRSYFENNGLDKKYWLDHKQHQAEFGFGSPCEQRISEWETALKKI